MEGLLTFGALRIRSELLGRPPGRLSARLPCTCASVLRPRSAGRPSPAFPPLFEGAALTPQGVLRIPVMIASRPLAVLDEILTTLESLVAGGGQGSAAVTPPAGSG